MHGNARSYEREREKKQLRPGPKNTVCHQNKSFPSHVDRDRGLLSYHSFGSSPLMLGETLGPWTLTHHFLLLKTLLKKNLCMTETTWTLFSKKKRQPGPCQTHHKRNPLQPSQSPALMITNLLTLLSITNYVPLWKPSPNHASISQVLGSKSIRHCCV
jgi:hypothetical protein